MAILIAGAAVLPMRERHDAEPITADVLVVGDRIEEIGTDLRAPADARVIDGRNRLLMPGLVNAHIHTEQNTFRGRYNGLPLEILMLYAYPMLEALPVSPDLVYLRTLLAGIESLKTGVTCILDDVIEVPGQTLEQLNAVFRAYEDIGMRANCSGHVMNRAFADTIPFLRDILPAEVRSAFDRQPRLSATEYLEYSCEAVRRFHRPDGRLRYIVAPSAPQRCTEELLTRTSRFASENDLGYHIHILETKTQVVTGEVQYGKTLIRYMHDIGALSRNTSIAHAIWVSDEDIELMCAAGCTVAHNPVCNLRIGSGIAPLRRFLAAGLNVALGTDGISSNDSCRLFDVMKLAGLVHTIGEPDYEQWPSAHDVIWAATRGGARAVMLEDEIGSVEVGKKADLVVLDMRTTAFTPLNRVANHVVFCENGSSIETVLVDGEIVVDNGRLTRVDEGEVLAEAGERLGAFIRRHEEVERAGSELERYFREAYTRCLDQEVGISRAGDEGPTADPGAVGECGKTPIRGGGHGSDGSRERGEAG